MLGNNMFAYCYSNPINWIDKGGNVPDEIDLNDNPADDLFPDTDGGMSGGPTGYNPTDAGYHYSIDMSQAANSSIHSGGLYTNGYTAYGYYSNPTSSTSTAACFITGTLIKAESGETPIESIKIGDLVWAWDEETGDVALKEVVETYVRESNELIHVFVDGEEIITTPTHPFYSPVKGWTEACKLRAGDILVLVNGEYVVIEKVQHEILETPVAVYNFQVEGYHTYYVTDVGILVHNACTNPYGKAGGPAHRNKVGEIGSDLKLRGYSVAYEYRVDTRGGYKSKRYLDIYATNGHDSIGIQVGRMNTDGRPVARERAALSDIIGSGVNAIFISYE